MDEIEKAGLMAKWVEISAGRVKAAPNPDDEKPRHDGGVSSKGGRGRKGGVEQAARDMGVPASTVRRAVKVASLSPEAKAAPQAVLMEAARAESPAAQVAVIEAAIGKAPAAPEDGHVFAAFKVA